VVTVRTIADEEFRARVGWEEDIRRTFADTSDVFEEAASVRFEVVETLAWESDDEADFHALHDAVAEVGPGEAELVVGVTAQYGASERTTEDRYHQGGSALWFGPSLLVVGGYPQVTGGSRVPLDTLVHELGHAFGAWHTEHVRDIMHRSSKSFPPTFGPASREAIRLLRGYDFRATVVQVRPPALERLAELYRADHHWSTPFPILNTLYHSAWEALDGEDPGRAIEFCRRGFEIERTLDVGTAELSAYGRAIAARAHLLRDEPEQALLLAREARELSNSVTYVMLIAGAAHAAGDLTQAKDMLRAAAEYLGGQGAEGARDESKARACLAAILSEEGRRHDALAEMGRARRALARAPDVTAEELAELDRKLAETRADAE
jgi:hypothetical protein